MARIRKAKPLLWVLAGVVVGLLALTLLGGHSALAQAPPPVSGAFPMAPNMDSPHFAINWDVNARGGGTIQSAHFIVSSTIGQPAVGTASSAHYEVCTGYWCWIKQLAKIFLPLVMK